MEFVGGYKQKVEERKQKGLYLAGTSCPCGGFDG